MSIVVRPIAICVPARNEAAMLPRLFDAIGRLERDDRDAISLCLLLDGCVDESEACALAYRDRSPYRVLIETADEPFPNAGRARHRAMTMGLHAIGGGDGMLLSTDADSMPDPKWVTSMSHALAQADVVLGKVVRTGERPLPLQDRIEVYYDALFRLRRRLDPVPWEASRTHHHAAGANMGVSASAYRQVGGFAALADWRRCTLCG